ncbi:winged helix-turn-helix transcriptional regulator [Streptomyces hundungensis]|uniref:winged helix-turn-helix transcriptional regulator n=1 Tax=Streptomyces hundungensis TaxID=1077946 RepID=UPI0033FA2930
MALRKDYDYAAQECSVARALEIIGERWTLLVVRDALYGVRRYNDFLVHLKIPRAVLAARLQTLTEAGVLEKRRYQEAPAREEYVPTELGRALWPTLRALGVWGRACNPDARPMRTFHHAECGTELGAYGECRACGRVVDAEDVEMRPGVGLGPGEDPVSRALRAPRRLLQPLFERRV